MTDTLRFSEIVYVADTKMLLEIEFKLVFTHPFYYGCAKVYELGRWVSWGTRKKFQRYRHTYQCAINKQELGRFSLKIEPGKIYFGPAGQLGMLPIECQGKGIGRYCVVRLINILSPFFGDAKVCSGKLSFVDADTEFKKNNRNTFYRNLGFTLELDDAGKHGRFVCNDSQQLTRKWNKKKIRQIDVQSLQHLLQRHESVIDKLESQTKRTQRAYELIDGFERKLITKNKVIKWLCFGLFVTVLASLAS